MLFLKIKQIISTKTSFNTKNIYSSKITSPHIPRRYVWFNVLLYTVNKSENLIAMSKSLKLRHFLRDFNVSRLWSVWIRRHTLTSIVKRYRRERSFREVFQCVKQTIYRSRTTLLLSATAAYKTDRDHEEADIPCRKTISDEDLEALISDLDDIEELSRRTLYCTNCGRRTVIDKKHSGVRYCTCKRSHVESCSHDGWVPYMEADDVIIWRKEYKPGQSYAYKVYGRYPELNAKDFAAVQIDGSYRKAWDAAVAFLKVIHDKANGIKDQTVLHWEVMWPRMFSNRDYVFIRRHKQFKITNRLLKHKEELFKAEYEDRPNVHSNAKRIALEAMKRDKVRGTEGDGLSKVFVIISRSCVHDDVPETKSAVRVKEYWSHMVVKSLDSGDKPGMEFVLTYYDDAGSGGLPGGVAAWATGRAAPAYLARMRRATADYQSSGQTIHMNEGTSNEPPEKSLDKCTQTESPAEMITQLLVTTIENITRRDADKEREEEKLVVETDTRAEKLSSEASDSSEAVDVDDGKCSVESIGESATKSDADVRKADVTQSEDTCASDKEEERPEENNGSWWKYMYPFYYFL